MFHTESDLLANLIVLSPKLARKQFRESIFESWNWKCAYCERQLSDRDATIDHILPKHKGGHSTRSNMACSCTNCNRSKGSFYWQEWYQSTPHYSEQRVDKIKKWMEQTPRSTYINSIEQESSCHYHDADFGWAAS